MGDGRPIGWWVKRLDEALEQVVDTAVAGDGLTRRHWQVLHALGPGGMTEADLDAVLAPFGGPGDALAELAGRGWVTRTTAGRLAHTVTGRAADARLFDRIGQLRRQVADGLSAEEYERTVAALSRMVRNVERALTDRPTPAAQPVG